MSYQLYRNTTLGNTLQESLDELIQVGFDFKCFHTSNLFGLNLKVNKNKVKN
jgi:hypothetical protein